MTGKSGDMVTLFKSELTSLLSKWNLISDTPLKSPFATLRKQVEKDDTHLL